MIRAARICSVIGCGEIAVDKGRCAEHGIDAWLGSTRTFRLPSDWAIRRMRALRRDKFLCQVKGDGCTMLATEVDHIINGDDHSLDNLQGICATCHRNKTQQEANARRRSRMNE